MRFILFFAIVSIVNANTLYDLDDGIDYNVFKTPRDFTGKVVLVTSSYSRIASVISKAFSSLGAELVLNGRNAQELKNISIQVQEVSPKKLKPLEVLVDVTKTEDLQNLINQTIKTFGRLDVVVNSAGNYLMSAIHDKDFMSVFDSTIEVDLRSYVELSYLSVPYLEETNGTIISISSIPTISPTHMAFGTAKAGVDLMTKDLAVELGPKVRVNSVSPGIILNNGEKDFEEYFKENIKRTPLKRHGLPIDIANSVVFLASDEANFISGANLYVDGGMMIFQ